MVWRFEVYETLGSTSDLCKKKADEGSKDKLAIQALLQTSGRGTRGRSWEDAGQNLAISFLFHPKNLNEFIKAIPFLAAVSIYETVKSFFLFKEDISSVSLKWPNDLLINGAKAAGILIESGAYLSDPWVVVGIGVNLQQAPAIEGRRLAALAEVMTPPDPIVFGEQLGKKLEEWEGLWEEKGFSFIRSSWLERAHPLGCHLAVKRDELYITGKFSGLDQQGRLLLTCPSGETIAVMTGDILLD
ncbi:biotin--[acetyl-CoA-carboxylase] ligase [Swingsia samuiensis]|uniref:biotin--[biotin carboxyl-carrier protein] ligase n=1 Tax=Swingsia samuiensis TaxID=1293412 RepID=A0A4Y6UGS3_9PROT|nr:biotin--[acetyl-CoA-carboxylase] ligase [Swingsia samuiensis]QDH16204.1 biotin--[acetyl-CoA-carboxylase] ligase [Swingsia samuiensis]